MEIPGKQDAISVLNTPRQHCIAFFLLLLLLAAAYSNTLDASWHLDDEPNIMANRRIHLKDLSWSSIRDALISTPTTSSVSFFRPLSRLSLALNHYFCGNEVFGYHVVNLFIHFLASFFLYLFLFNTFSLRSVKNEYGSCSFLAALTATLFWALHPIQTQAVTYIVQRMTSMAGMFYIMAMYFFVRSKMAQAKRARIVLLALCSTCGLLSFGAKENAVLLPLSLFLFHSLLVETPGPGAWKRIIILLFLFYFLPLLIGLAYLETAHGAITKIFNIYENRTFTMLERLLTEPRVLLFYMSLLLYPMPYRFSIDHDLIVSRSLFNPESTIVSILVISGVMVAACFQARQRPLLAFSVLFFFLNHALESTILPMELVFEHRNYLPSMLFFVPAAALVMKGLATFSNRIMRVFILLSLCLILIAFGYSSFVRNAVWHDEKSLWEDVLVKYPHSFRAHTNLGRHLVLQGHDERAAHEFLQALESSETHRRVEKAIALYNLGYIAHRRGDHQTALHFYTRALEKDLCCPRANNNLAVLLLETGDGGTNDSEALDHLNKALECNHEEEIESAYANKRALLIKMGKANPLGTGPSIHQRLPLK